MSKHKKHYTPEAAPEDKPGDQDLNGTAEAWSEEVVPSEPASFDAQAALLRQALSQAEDRLLRLRAEFDNYRRRALQDLQRAREQAADRVVMALLPALDDLERVRQTVGGPGEAESLHRGLDLVMAKFARQLELVEVRAFESKGQRFDPELHEALTVAQDPQQDDELVLEESVKGYRRGQTVIRHAQVIVNKRHP